MVRLEIVSYNNWSTFHTYLLVLLSNNHVVVVEKVLNNSMLNSKRMGQTSMVVVLFDSMYDVEVDDDDRTEELMKNLIHLFRLLM